MTDAVLTLNAGSSSLKFALFEADPGAGPEDLRVLARGQVEGLGEAPHLSARGADGQIVEDRVWPDGAGLAHEAFLHAVLDFCDAHLGADRLVCAGHRVVHGGDLFAEPVMLNAQVMDQLESLDALAPLHQPHNLAAAHAAMAARPDLPQVAVFDTAFHQSITPVARRFGLPRAYEERGVRRYGFHGLSYAWLTRRLAKLDPDLASGRVVFAHLGAGASLCATLNGVSQDTTMGFTALDGLVMSTRCGALDPGVVLHLMSADGMSAEDITALLYKKSGLLGVSGVSGDMRTLLASDNPHAAEAVDLFVYRVAREIGALAMTLGGLDGVVFSAGIGENAGAIRVMIAERLAWMGLSITDTDGHAERRISTADSRIRAYVIPTDEERMIAAGALSRIS